MSLFQQYVAHGWALCSIQPGSKGPRAKGWNNRENVIRTADEAAILAGAGLCHAYSGTCALDIDDYDAAANFFKDRGFELMSLFVSEDAVLIDSGRSNRAKLLFALRQPLPSKVFADGAFELRCGTAGGKTAQDVLPPTIHPMTHKPYEWRGDWKNLPPLPEVLHKLWVSSLSEQISQPVNETTDYAELRDLLSRKNSDCGYDEWIKAGMAVHHETGGNDEGFAIWDAWSAPSDKYPGAANLRSHWVSFGRSATPVTVDSLRRCDVATVAEFEDFPAQVPDWLEQATAEVAIQKPTFKWLSLSELFERPAPDWIIEGILPEAGIGSFWGQPGGGKTFLAVDIALAVALGQTWRGYPVKAGGVLYIAAEDDSGVQARFAAGLASRGATDAAVRVLPSAPVFTAPKQAEALLVSIKALGPQSLVFVDTLAAVTPGSDENTGKDMGQLIHFCQKIHKVTGGLVLLIHHEGKTTGRGPRGWSGLHGAFEVEWEITDQEHSREMRVSKMKNAPTGNIYNFQLLPFGESCTVEWI